MKVAIGGLAPRNPPAKRMTVEEFRRLGYLQELNRRFLHPLGLALEVEVPGPDEPERFGGIWDYRYDPEGIYYAPGIIDREKAQHVQDERFRLSYTRFEDLGYVVQPVPREGEEDPDA